MNAWKRCELVCIPQRYAWWTRQKFFLGWERLSRHRRGEGPIWWTGQWFERWCTRRLLKSTVKKGLSLSASCRMKSFKKTWYTLFVVRKSSTGGLNSQPGSRVWTFERDGQFVAIGVERPVVYDTPAGSDIGHCVNEHSRGTPLWD